MPRSAKKKRTSRLSRGKHPLSKMNMKIHQVYGIFDDGIPLGDIPVFKRNVDKTVAFCNNYDDIDYKMWNLKQCNQLVKQHFPEYMSLWTALKKKSSKKDPNANPIMAADFIRYCILYHEGGIYVDCDIHPIKDIRKLFNKSFFFVRWPNDKRKLPYNAILGARKGLPLYKDILEECKRSYEDKSQKSIYKKWKGRYIFQITGHYMIQRVIKRHKVQLKDMLNILRIHTKSGKIIQGPKPLFEDSNASLWYSGNK